MYATDVRQKHRLMPPLIRGRDIIIIIILIKILSYSQTSGSESVHLRLQSTLVVRVSSKSSDRDERRQV